MVFRFNQTYMSAANSDAVRGFEIKRVTSGRCERTADTIAVEEPLDIRIHYWFKESPRVQSLALTMRTPGFDRELTAGFLLSEGIIRGADDLLDLRAIGTEPSNEIVAELAPHVDLETWRLGREMILNSSCGICGKRSRDALTKPESREGDPEFRVSRYLLERLPGLLAERQEGFSKTGGLHASALLDSEGNVEEAFEDIGRHNALDKLIGSRLLVGRIPLHERVLFLSSRSSFELVQKTAMAGGKVLATIGGPSSLAVETARAFGITLIGFLRDGRFNIYSGDWRIDLKE